MLKEILALQKDNSKDEAYINAIYLEIKINREYVSDLQNRVTHSLTSQSINRGKP
jgi:hypothetical protein